MESIRAIFDHVQHFRDIEEATDLPRTQLDQLEIFSVSGQINEYIQELNTKKQYMLTAIKELRKIEAELDKKAEWYTKNKDIL